MNEPFRERRSFSRMVYRSSLTCGANEGNVLQGIAKMKRDVLGAVAGFRLSPFSTAVSNRRRLSACVRNAFLYLRRKPASAINTVH